MSAHLLLSMSSIIKAAKDQASSKLAGECVILHLGSGSYFGLNEVGTRIWDLIQDAIAVNEVRDIVFSEYDVELVDCERDVLAICQQLVDQGLVEVMHRAEVA